MTRRRPERARRRRGRRSRRAASSTARASRTIPRSSRGWPSGTRCWATRRTTLRAVRDPARLGAALRDAGPYPRTSVDAPPTSGRWLRKPLRGGGGTRRARVARRQRCRPGRSCRSASTGSRARRPRSATARDAVVLGLTEQLVGRRAFGVRGYRWCGNLVPPRLPPASAACSSRRARSARAWRPRSRCGACSASTSSGTASARGRSRSTRARPRRWRRSRRPTAWRVRRAPARLRR